MAMRAPRGAGLPPAPAALIDGPRARGRLRVRRGWLLVMAMAAIAVAWAATVPSASLGPALRHRGAFAQPPGASGRAPGAPALPVSPVRATFPFLPPHSLRVPTRREALPPLYTDGLPCSIGCRVAAAVPGWPLWPFHQPHPLRAGINELRPQSLHVGVDIQARDGARVYAVEPGEAVVLDRSGPNARVQVGSFIYWHVRPLVHTGQRVQPYSTVLGTVMGAYGHLAFSEVDATGQYVNPLRPGGRVLAPWVDRMAPVIGHPSLAADGTAIVATFDPQSTIGQTTYVTPVLAPAALAYRLYDGAGEALTPLRFAFRGTHLLAWAQRRDIYTPDARSPGFACFAGRPVCRPRWVFWLAGGLAPPLPTGLAPGRYRLTVYAWDWADNRSALDMEIRLGGGGWHPRGHVPPRPPLVPAPRVAPRLLRPPPLSLRQIPFTLPGGAAARPPAPDPAVG
jgi:hypothetical protein